MTRYGTEGMKYVLVARGIFSTYSARRTATQSFASAAKMATGGKATRALDSAGKSALDEVVASLKS